jgi:hypothetical protein
MLVNAERVRLRAEPVGPIRLMFLSPNQLISPRMPLRSRVALTCGAWRCASPTAKARARITSTDGSSRRPRQPADPACHAAQRGCAVRFFGERLAAFRALAGIPARAIVVRRRDLPLQPGVGAGHDGRRTGGSAAAAIARRERRRRQRTCRPRRSVFHRGVQSDRDTLGAGRGPGFCDSPKPRVSARPISRTNCGSAARSLGSRPRPRREQARGRGTPADPAEQRSAGARSCSARADADDTRLKSRGLLSRRILIPPFGGSNPPASANASEED